MADVFLSYARKDAGKALIIKEALEALGLNVFFDTDGLDGGDVFPDVLEREIRRSGAVVSVWNTWALSREWVRRECDIAREEKLLIPVEIGDISDSVMTLALSKIHRIDLRDFDGAADHAGWDNLVRALARTLKRPDLIKARKSKAKEEAHAEKLAAELAKQKARNKKLAKGRRGLGWKGAAVILVALVAFAGIGGKLAMDYQAEQIRNKLIPPEVRASLADFDIDAPNAPELLANMLDKVKIRDLIRAAEADSNAALLAGWAFDYGEGGVSQDLEESVRLYQLSCDGGNMRGCRNLANQFSEGDGIEEDNEAANALYRQACDGGDMGGCTNLGAQLANGDGAEEDDEAANALYRQACDGGNMGGCNNLGTQLVNGDGLEEDDEAANTLYRQACDGGNMLGCTNLGAQLANGEGTEEDDEAANALFRQACNGGHMLGCNNLGWQLANGDGAEEDDEAANALYRQACDGGDMLGCGNLGVQLANGEGAEEDDEAAATLYQQACDGGHIVGCSSVGNWTYLGRGGITQDKTEGLRLLREACDAGHQWSCRRFRALEE